MDLQQPGRVSPHEQQQQSQQQKAAAQREARSRSRDRQSPSSQLCNEIYSDSEHLEEAPFEHRMPSLPIPASGGSSADAFHARLPSELMGSSHERPGTINTSYTTPSYIGQPAAPSGHSPTNNLWTSSSPTSSTGGGGDRLSKRLSTLSNSPSESSIAEDPDESASDTSSPPTDARPLQSSTSQQHSSAGSSANLPASTSHRLSSTPHNPSPLARALYDDDSIENLDINDEDLAAAQQHLQDAGTSSSSSSTGQGSSHEPFPWVSGSRQQQQQQQQQDPLSRRRSDVGLAPSRWPSSARRSPNQSLKGRVLSPKSSTSSLSSGSTSNAPSQGSNSSSIVERRSSVAHQRGPSGGVEYVPSSKVNTASPASQAATPHGASPSSSTLPPGATDALSLRRSYHEKQSSDSARSLDAALMRNAVSPSTSPSSSSKSNAGGDSAQRHHRRTSSGGQRSISPEAFLNPTHPSQPGSGSSAPAFAPSAFEQGSPSSVPVTCSALSRSLTASASSPRAGPSEAITLQRVPTAVRIAQSLHGPSSPTSPTFSMASSSGPKSFSDRPTEYYSPLPITPTATRANTPSSSSGNSSAVPSGESSRLPSQRGSPKLDPATQHGPPLHMTPSPLPGPSRSSDEDPSTFETPRFAADKNGRPSQTSSSLTPSGSSASLAGQTPRRQSVLSPPYTSDALTFEFGGGRGQPGLSRGESSHDVSGVTTSLTQNTRRAQNRVSAQPMSALGPLSTEGEYARIIQQSRTAKMKKWGFKPDAFEKLESTGQQQLDASHQPSSYQPPHLEPGHQLEGDGLSRRRSVMVPGSEHNQNRSARRGESLSPMAPHRRLDTAPSQGMPWSFDDDLGADDSATKDFDVQWVDWLDEYRRIKEAAQSQSNPANVTISDQEAVDSPTVQPETSKVGPLMSESVAMKDYSFPPQMPTTSDVPPAADPIKQPLTPMEPRAPPAALRRTTSHMESGFLGRAPSSVAPTQQPARAGQLVGGPPNRRKRTTGALARIDAWWGAVRNSFGPPGSQSAPSQPPLLSTGNRERSMSPKSNAPSPGLGPPEASEAADKWEMPPPPVPVKKPKPPQPTSSDPIIMQAKGALAPAARISPALARPGMGARSGSAQSAGSSSASDSPPPTAVLAQRRNLLPLSLDKQRSVAAQGGSSRSSSSSRHLSRDSSMQTPPIGRAERLGRETTPGLTPGHSPVWDKTPGLVPGAASSEGHTTQSSQPTRPALTRSSSSNGGPASFSLQTVRNHIRQNLQHAKDNCDAQLRKTIEEITFYVDTELRRERAAMLDVSESAVDTDAGESDKEELTTASESLSASPRRNKRQSYSLGRSPGGTDSPMAGRRKPSASLGKRHPGRSDLAASPPARQRLHERRPSGLSPHPQELSAALNRHLSSTNDGQLKPRSTSSSRSHSPFVPASRDTELGYRRKSSGHATPSRLEMQESSPFVTALQDIITIATEIQDTSVAALSARPNTVNEFLDRVQSIGNIWDENRWPRRNLFSGTLLAVATLKRVISWWEAEKGFWNFDEETETWNNDPISFFSKSVANADGRSRSDSLASKAPAPEETSEAPAVPDSEALGSANQPRSAPEQEGGQAPEISRGRAEDLRNAVEEVRNATIMMELSLDGRRFHYLSPVWEDVVGLDPVECLGQPISDLLFPEDSELFREATEQLLSDSSHTVEVRFRIKVFAPEDESGNESDEAEEEQHGSFDRSRQSTVWEAMEGKGMCIYNRDSGEPDHTMWVLRPVGSPEKLAENRQVPAKFGLRRLQRSLSDPNLSLPFSLPLRQEPLLCRICERHLPTWFFEKHNETCIETHRLDSSISEGNEHLSELMQTIEGLAKGLEESSPPSPLEYRGSALLSPSSAAFKDVQREHGRRSSEVSQLQSSILANLLEHTGSARSLSAPIPVDDEERTSRSLTDLLSPRSESLLATLLAWSRPSCDDPALAQLVSDVDDCVREKVDAVARMRNTMIYAERVRQEWEERAAQAASSDMTGRIADGPTIAGFGSSHPVDPPAEDLTGLGLAGLDPDFGDIASRRRSSTLFSNAPNDGNAPSATDTGAGVPGSLVMDDEVEDASANMSRLSVADQDAGSARTKTRTPSSLGRLGSPVLLPSVSPLIPQQALPSSSSQPTSLGEPLANPSQPPKQAQSKHRAASIKDFEVIKPISKGAFGSVYLAKKRVTGDYYAIKVLRKSDMVAKNQVTNVKAERIIMMNQASSEFVVKLFWTFQSRDYLYLVMEYLNGGDCAALIKAMGALEEDWARSYIAEVILGLDHLHSKGVVHRDLKPDNLLIDARGHLKLTDFGLSKIGLLGRQSHVASLADTHSAYGRGNGVNSSTPSSESGLQFAPGSYFATPPEPAAPELFGTNAASNKGRSHALSFGSSTSGTSGAADLSLGAAAASGKPKLAQGTPDYLSPESILGSVSGETVDWWALGVICYEFLYGFPPFNDDTPDKVFDNILSRRVCWYEDQIEVSPEARDFMERLMCMNPESRLGARGAEEVKTHPFMRGVDWDNLLSQDAVFVPRIADPESTEYFDARGAAGQVFEDDEAVDPALADPAPQPYLERRQSGPEPASPDAGLDRGQRSGRALSKVASEPFETLAPATTREPPGRSHSINVASQMHSSSSQAEDFGTFNFKNVEVLKQANQEVIRKLRSEQGGQPSDPLENLSSSIPKSHIGRSSSISFKNDPTSPTGSASSSTSSPFGSLLNANASHGRRPSDQPVVHNKPSAQQGDLSQRTRRKSLPPRWRSASASALERSLIPSDQHTSGQRGSAVSPNSSTPPSSAGSPHPKTASLPPKDSKNPEAQHASSPGASPKTVDVLVAEDNPISSKVLETLLIRLGCRCVVVHNGEEVMRCTMGELVFDVIFLDLMMPILDGESAARMIRSTKNANQHTPIVAVTSYELSNFSAEDNNAIFSAVLTKPVQKNDVLSVFDKIGFRAITRDQGSHQGGGASGPALARKQASQDTPAVSYPS